MRAHDLEGTVSIGGDVDHSAIVTGDHNIVIQNFVEGIRRLPTDYATRIQNCPPELTLHLLRVHAILIHAG
jgi:hypothetical protein